MHSKTGVGEVYVLCAWETTRARVSSLRLSIMSMGSKSTSLISRLIMSSMSFNLDFTAFSLNYMGELKSLILLTSTLDLYPLTDLRGFKWLMLITEREPAPNYESGPFLPPCFIRANLITSFISNFQVRLSFIIYSSSSGSRWREPQKDDSPCEKWLNFNIFYKFGGSLNHYWVTRHCLKLSFPWLAHHKYPFEVMHVIFIWVDAAALLVHPGKGKYFIVLSCRIWHPHAWWGEVVRVGPRYTCLRPHEERPVLLSEGVAEEY
jgi:hypothetical protein